MLSVHWPPHTPGRFQKQTCSASETEQGCTPGSRGYLHGYAPLHCRADSLGDCHLSPPLDCRWSSPLDRPPVPLDLHPHSHPHQHPHGHGPIHWRACRNGEPSRWICCSQSPHLGCLPQSSHWDCYPQSFHRGRRPQSSHWDCYPQSFHRGRRPQSSHWDCYPQSPHQSPCLPLTHGSCCSLPSPLPPQGYAQSS